jgi:hypothetical protein
LCPRGIIEPMNIFASIHEAEIVVPSIHLVPGNKSEHNEC